MQNNKPVKKISKRYFTFFGGIAFCLFAVILILNGRYVARAIAFPFAYLFGLGSYVMVYAYSSVKRDLRSALTIIFLVD